MCIFSLGVLRSSDKQKLKEVIRAEGRRSLFVDKIRRRNRAAASEKLYLLLGQLRTDG